MKIAYETLPESAKKAYNQANAVRKISMFAAAILSVILSLVFIFGVKDFNFWESLEGGFIFGCCIHGLIHGANYWIPLFKKFLKSLLLIYIPPIPIVRALIFCIVTYIAAIVGFPLLVIDVILYLRKKPLVYSFEHSSFLKLKSVQEEMQVMAMQEMQQQGTHNKIAELKQMFDDGLITEEEYNQKKSELLSNI